MEKKFWLEKWDKNEIGFHQKNINPFLIKHFSNLSPCTFFVPLCGKSTDMLWLIEQGHQVVGVELSPLACRAFFEENKIIYEVKTEGDFTVFISEKVTLWCGDFFQLPPLTLGKIDKIYDRASLIALPSELLKKYAQTMINLISIQKNKVQMLIISLEYDQTKIPGPPFSISFKEVESLYAQKLKLETLYHEIHPDMAANNPRFLGVKTWENVFYLSTF